MEQIENEILKKKIDSFPLLPETASKVIEITGNPESSANDLIQAILPDQSTCVSILKIANSALYGRPKKVSSLETAVVVLGMNEVRNIVLSHAVVSSMHTLLQKNTTAVNKFWDHSFTCGLAARNIAGSLNLQSGDFFIGGLIHDIGKLAMLMTFPEEYFPDQWMNSFSSNSKRINEEKTFSLTHNLAGKLILEKWQFPQNLLSAIEFHHDPLSGRDENILFSLVIQLADALAHFATESMALNDMPLTDALESVLPEIKSQWRGNALLWDQVRIESWFAWIIIERNHGSSVMQLFSSNP